VQQVAFELGRRRSRCGFPQKAGRTPERRGTYCQECWWKIRSTQDVFIRVYRSRHTYEPTAKFATWLYCITTNVALNHCRDEKKSQNQVSLDVQDTAKVRREAQDHALLIEDRLIREVVVRQIRHAIQALPPKQRTAVIMHRYDEMDYSQIAHILGCSSSAVKSLIFRAHETLRIRLRSLGRPPYARAGQETRRDRR
jgi:RNA polymerase sigma factor (sigma-70 family)